MQHIMGMGNNNDALRVFLNDGDPYLGLTVFPYGAPPQACKDQRPDLPPREPKVMFSLRWLRIVYGVFCAIFKSREFKAIQKAHARNRNDVVYFRVLEKLGTTIYGAVGKVMCLHESNNRTLIGKVDPVIMFDEVDICTACTTA